MYQENGKDCMYNCQSSNLHLANSVFYIVMGTDSHTVL